MSNPDEIRMLLSMFVVQLPTLVVCFIAGVVLLGRWRDASSGAVWALLGFGLALVLCIAVPVAQVGLQEWMKQSSMSIGERTSAFAGLGFLWSVLRAVSYGFLLVAIFAGRPSSSSSTRSL